MQSFEYTIQDECGLHARPAGLLVKEVRNHQSRITLSANGKQAEANKLLALMSMGIRCGTKVHIEIEGPDEGVCVEAMKTFFAAHL